MIISTMNEKGKKCVGGSFHSKWGAQADLIRKVRCFPALRELLMGEGRCRQEESSVKAKVGGCLAH